MQASNNKKHRAFAPEASIGKMGDYVWQIYAGHTADLWQTYGRYMADGRRTYGARWTYGGHTANIRRTCAKNGCGHTACIRRTYDIMIFRFHNKHKADIYQQFKLNKLFLAGAYLRPMKKRN